LSSATSRCLVFGRWRTLRWKPVGVVYLSCTRAGRPLLHGCVNRDGRPGGLPGSKKAGATDKRYSLTQRRREGGFETRQASSESCHGAYGRCFGLDRVKLDGSCGPPKRLLRAKVSWRLEPIKSRDGHMGPGTWFVHFYP